VAAVCHVPHCAHPSYTQGYYDRDNEFYLQWDKVSSDAKATQAWLEEWVYNLPDRDSYWARLGPQVHQRLAVKPRWSQPVNYGEF
jgi:glutaconate CoA-transferase subunit A